MLAFTKIKEDRIKDLVVMANYTDSLSRGGMGHASVEYKSIGKHLLDERAVRLELRPQKMLDQFYWIGYWMHEKHGFKQVDQKFYCARTFGASV